MLLKSSKAVNAGSSRALYVCGLLSCRPFLLRSLAAENSPKDTGELCACKWLSRLRPQQISSAVKSRRNTAIDKSLLDCGVYAGLPGQESGPPSRAGAVRFAASLQESKGLLMALSDGGAKYGNDISQVLSSSRARDWPSIYAELRAHGDVHLSSYVQQIMEVVVPIRGNCTVTRHIDGAPAENQRRGRYGPLYSQLGRRSISYMPPTRPRQVRRSFTSTSTPNFFRPRLLATPLMKRSQRISNPSAASAGDSRGNGNRNLFRKTLGRNADQHARSPPAAQLHRVIAPSLARNRRPERPRRSTPRQNPGVHRSQSGGRPHHREHGGDSLSQADSISPARSRHPPVKRPTIMSAPAAWSARNRSFSTPTVR